MGEILCPAPSVQHLVENTLTYECNTVKSANVFTRKTFQLYNYIYASTVRQCSRADLEESEEEVEDSFVDLWK